MDASACGPNLCADITAGGLNRDCRCIGIDQDRLQAALAKDAGADSLLQVITATRPHLFAQLPVFVGQTHIAQMRAAIAAIETVVALPGYRERVLKDAPDVARPAFGPSGAFLGYDFHLGPNGPQLIEINTNAGGGLLNSVLARAQRPCCVAVEPLLAAPGHGGIEPENAIIEMFATEWRRQRGDAVLRRVAIVDDDPQTQYLWPEFLLFQRLFERSGYEAVIADPRELLWRDGTLNHDNRPVDLIYNRLTDFMLADAAHAHLHAAYLAGAVVLTPHPHAHAVYANKKNLVLLSDATALASLGAPRDAIATLGVRVPRSVLVTAENAEALWEQRRRLFFKPAAGFGSRAAYRGDKLTRRVWEEILIAGDYIAQDRVEPSDRRIAIGEQLVDLKLDLRCYVYAGNIQLIAARLYQGQTTNFRTPGGGFAPVFTAPD